MRLRTKMRNEILPLLCHGYAQKQIADKVCLAQTTVRDNIIKAYKDNGFTNATQLAVNYVNEYGMPTLKMFFLGLAISASLNVEDTKYRRMSKRGKGVKREMVIT